MSTKHMVLLHVVGDWPWLTDSGRLARSFRNVPKHVSRKKPPTGVCHWCRAGQPGCDFEQVNSNNPKWLETMFTESVSDPTAAPSPLLRIAHPPGKEASLFMWDLFHTWHLGVAKAFLSSWAYCFQLVLTFEMQLLLASLIHLPFYVRALLQLCRERHHRRA